MHKLDVIVITYNRTDLLEKSLHSICNSSYNDCVIKLFNNGGTAINSDFIKPFREKYPDKKIEYHSVPVNCQGISGIENIQKLMKAEYAVLFHDDDLIHPYYLENAMAALEKHPDTVLLTSLAHSSTHPDDLPYDPTIKKECPLYSVGDERMLAALYLTGINICFPSTIYKTSIYKEHVFDWEPYLKHGDRISTIYYASFGKTLILYENYIYYRLHVQSDTQRKENVASIEKIRNLFQFYKNRLSEKDDVYYDIWKYLSKKFILNLLKNQPYTLNLFDDLYYHCTISERFRKKEKSTLKLFEKNAFPQGITLENVMKKNSESFVFYPEDFKIKYSLSERIFSVKNINKNGYKRTYLAFLGIRIRLKKNKAPPPPRHLQAISKRLFILSGERNLLLRLQ